MLLRSLKVDTKHFITQKTKILITPVAAYGSETWAMTAKDEETLTISETSLL